MGVFFLPFYQLYKHYTNPMILYLKQRSKTEHKEKTVAICMEML